MASLLSKVGASSLGFVAGRAVAGLAGLLLLRALGPEQAGVYGAALGFAGLFSLGASLGMDSALAGSISRDPARAGQRWSAGLTVVAGMGVLVALLLAGFLRLGGGAQVPSSLVLLAFAVVMLGALGQMSAGAMQGLGDFRRTAVLGSASSLVNGLGLLALLLAGAASASAALWTALATAGLGLGLWAWGRRRELAWVTPDRAALGSALTLTLPFALMTVGYLVFLRVDQALLAHMVTPVALGLYVAGVRLVDLMAPILNSLFAPLHTHLAGLFTRAAAGDAEAGALARRALARASRSMAAISWPLGVGGSVLAPLIIRAVYGPAFDGAAPAFACLAWVAALMGVEGSLLQGVHGLGRTGMLVRLYAVALALNVGLNLWLIPRYGILASAALSAGGELLNLGFLWLWCRRAGLGLTLRGLAWPALPAALGMGLALAWAAPALASAGLGAAASVALLVAAGAAVYGALLALLGFFGPDERQLLGRLLGRAS